MGTTYGKELVVGGGVGGMLEYVLRRSGEDSN